MPSLDLNLGLKDFLASLTRWLPMPVTEPYKRENLPFLSAYRQN